MVTKLDRKQTTVLEQNPNFWGDPKPKMDRILLDGLRRPRGRAARPQGEQARRPHLRQLPLGPGARERRQPAGLVVRVAGLHRDRLQLVPARGRRHVHRPGQGRQRRGRAGPGDPPGAGLRHRPPGPRRHRLRGPGDAGQRAHLAVLQPLLRGLLGRPRVRLRARPGEGQGGPGGGRLDVRGQRRLREGRRQGAVRADDARRQHRGDQRRQAHQGVGARGGHRHRRPARHRGRDQQQDLRVRHQGGHLRARRTTRSSGAGRATRTPRTSTSRSCAPARRGRTRTTRTRSTTRSRWSRGRRWATTRSASTSCTSPRR